MLLTFDKETGLIEYDGTLEEWHDPCAEYAAIRESEIAHALGAMLEWTTHTEGDNPHPQCPHTQHNGRDNQESRDTTAG